MKPVLRTFLLAAGLAASLGASATPIVEVGKNVVRADFSLTFTGIFTGRDLSAYEESGIFVTTPGVALSGQQMFSGDPRLSGFYYGDGGNESFATIRGVNSEVFAAADFLLGNGWSLPSNFMRYSTYLNGVLTGSGVTQLDSGIVRISDLGGFDELRLNSHALQPAEYGSFQAIALDDMNLQLWEPEAAVPEPGQIALLGAAVIALRAARRKASA
jgi:hypothetical protein